LPARWILIALGIFVFGYGIFSLRSNGRPRSHSKWWSVPTGLIGGLISGVFGMGGPIYVVYLNGRVTQPAQLRATLSTMFTINTAARLILFVISGLLLQRDVWVAALYLVPFMAIGLYLGHRLHLRLSAAQIGHIISALLLLTGLSILAKAMLMA
jgi:uncharacterized membrane protein YfcA